VRLIAVFALCSMALCAADKKGVVTVETDTATIIVSTKKVGKFEPGCPAALCSIYLKVVNKRSAPLPLDLPKFFIRTPDGKALKWLPPDEAVDRWFSRLARWIGSRESGNATLDNMAGDMKKRILTPGDVPAESFREGLLYFEGPDKRQPSGATVHLVGLHDQVISLAW